VTELHVDLSANLLGDIVTAKLAIEPGANFSGSCSMGASIKNIKSFEANENTKEKSSRSVS
jgi:cytoskeletal protein CcmA (bactofilin family)